MTDPAVLFFAGLVGLALGSFLNVCVVRWPRGASVVRPGSACPACSKPVRWHDQIPVVSWLVLRARCRACGARISLRYPLVEAAAAAICVAMVLTRSVSLEAAGGSLFLLILLGIALTDARCYLIPDEFSLGGAAAGLALALAPGGITPGTAALGATVGFGGMWLVGVAGTWMIVRASPGRLEAAGREHADGRRRTRDTRVVHALSRPPGQLAALLPAVPAAFLTGRGFGWAGALAAVAGCAATVAILVAWVEGLGEEAGAAPADAHTPVDVHTPAVAPTPAAAHASPGAVVGGGDVKMMALVGAFTGPWGAVLTVFLAAFVGVLAYLALRLLVRTRQLIPFGVFLAVGAATTLLFGEAILSWYLSLPGLS